MFSLSTRCFLLIVARYGPTPFGTDAAAVRIRRSPKSSHISSAARESSRDERQLAAEEEAQSYSHGSLPLTMRSHSYSYGAWYDDLPPAIYMGFGNNPEGNAVPDVALPLSVDEAVGMGWELNETSSRWQSTDTELPHVLLTFEEGHLSGISVISPPSPLFVPFENGISDISFKDESDRFSLVANTVGVPLSSTTAEREDWNEGGCVKFMGGSHYYKFQSGIEDDWASALPVVPIYNKYGTDKGEGEGGGKLSTLLLIFDDKGVYPSDGFDAKGFSLNKIFGCDLNFCSDPKCIEHMNSSPDVTGFSTMHVFFSNPANRSNWGECQAPSCDVPLCSCCGSRDNPSGPRNCTKPF